MDGTAIRQAKKGEEISDEEIESKIDAMADDAMKRSEEHTSELQSQR